jgi:Ran-binding protein 3
MADDTHNASDLSDPADGGDLGSGGAPAQVEDAETTAARKELREASISEKMSSTAVPHASQESVEGTQEATQENTQVNDRPSDDIELADQPQEAIVTKDRKTPEPTAIRASRGNFEEQIASPKKKRAHDQFDESKEGTAVADGSQKEQKEAAAAASQANDRVTTSRTERDEPEKKRPRDQLSADEEGKEKEEKSQTAAADKPAATTSSAAFAKSGFAKLASSASSPFGSLGGSSQPNLFGGGGGGGASPFGSLGVGSKPLSSFSSSTTTPAPPKLSAPSGVKSSASPFSTITGPSAGAFEGSKFGSTEANGGSKTFGSAFSSSVIGGPRLTTFAQPGGILKSDKPARPFGAPDSDAEDGEDDDETGKQTTEDDSEGKDGSEEEGGEEEKKRRTRENDTANDVEKEDAKNASDDKRRTKLQKGMLCLLPEAKRLPSPRISLPNESALVVVDDGEAGEVTILAVRAKMYLLEDKAAGWKERGAGMLKINVPYDCIEFDESSGQPLPGTFHASPLQVADAAAAKEKKIVRLLMRQDHTLRVILNTALTGATEFKETAGLKATSVLFTAFDGAEARPVQMKVYAS